MAALGSRRRLSSGSASAGYGELHSLRLPSATTSIYRSLVPPDAERHKNSLLLRSLLKLGDSRRCCGACRRWTGLRLRSGFLACSGWIGCSVVKPSKPWHWPQRVIPSMCRSVPSLQPGRLTWPRLQRPRCPQSLQRRLLRKACGRRSGATISGTLAVRIAAAMTSGWGPCQWQATLPLRHLPQDLQPADWHPAGQVARPRSLG